jgi:hypothetical protein
MKQKYAVFLIESVGGQSSREITTWFFPQSNQAHLRGFWKTSYGKGSISI